MLYQHEHTTMKKRLAIWLGKPTPLINNRTVTEEPQIVRLFKTGGPEITNPTHGMTGWYNGKPLIYNDRWGERGWYLVTEYQKIKASETEKPDWRVLPTKFYEEVELPTAPEPRFEQFGTPRYRTLPMGLGQRHY